MQGVVCLGIRGEPILAVDLLPPGSELREKILLASFFPANIRNRLAVSLHDLEIVVIDPDSSLKIALLAYDLFGRKIEHIAMQLVLLLLPHVKNLIFRNFVAGKHEGQPVPYV